MTKTITVVCDPDAGKIYGSIEEAREDYFFENDGICEMSHEYACGELERIFYFEDLINAIVTSDRSVLDAVRCDYYKYVAEQDEENFQDWLDSACIVNDIEVEV